MNKKWLPYILILVLGIILFFVRRTSNDNTSTATTSKKSPSEPAGKINRNRGFDRRVSYLEYTHHAKCRMQCRNISQEEVKEIMRDGKINYNKSDVNAMPCPEYAVEGITSDNQRVRIVFAQCDLKSKVVTTIDLNTDWSCDCPGDDKKQQNKN
jgi:hypothetical protein